MEGLRKRKGLKNLVSCLIFAVLLTLAIFKCADVLEYKEARQKYTDFYKSETNFDVIFLGTSHVKDHILPMELWKEQGIASYNWGNSNCTPAESYYTIREVLKYTSPRVVVLDAYGLVEYEEFGNGKYRTDRIEQQHVQFDSMPLTTTKIEAVNDIFDDYEGRSDFLWNFIMYHNRWTELGEGDFDYKLSTEKGAEFLTGLGNGSYELIDEDLKTEIDSVCYPYFLKIIEYCEEQGIPVLCLYLPYPSGESKQRIANTLGDIVEQYSNCTYVNGYQEDLLNFKTDIAADNSHLNYSGARKVTAWLGTYLAEHYDLDDYSSNAAWEQDYDEYYQYKIEVLEDLTYLTDYLVQLADDDFIGELEIYDEELMNNTRLKALCENAGITPVLEGAKKKSCAKLTIYSARSKEKVTTVKFKRNSSKEWKLSDIVKRKTT